MPALGRTTEFGLELDLDGAVCDRCHRRPQDVPRVLSTSLGVRPSGRDDGTELYSLICSGCVARMAQALLAQGVLQEADLRPDPRGGLLDFRRLAEEWDRRADPPPG